MSVLFPSSTHRTAYPATPPLPLRSNADTRSELANTATVRPRRYTASGGFDDATLRAPAPKPGSSWTSSEKPRPDATDGDPNHPSSSPTAADAQWHAIHSEPVPDLFLGARRTVVREHANEAIRLAEMADRRRSVEEIRIMHRVDEETDDSTVRFSRVQERRRALHDYGAGGGARRPDYKSHSTADLPYVAAGSDSDSSPKFPSRSRPTSAHPYSSSTPAASRFFRNINGHRRRAEERRKRSEKEEEVRVRSEAERQLKEAWANYESRWNILNMTIRSPTPRIRQGFPHRQSGAVISPSIELAFIDIPWPLLRPARDMLEINNHTLNEFFLSIHLPQDKAVVKERLRGALLRWHPDRFEGRFLHRICEEDRQDVMDAVGVVVRFLNSVVFYQT